MFVNHFLFCVSINFCLGTQRLAIFVFSFSIAVVLSFLLTHEFFTY